MTTPIPAPTPRQAARIAGVGYVLIFFLAIFANFVVVEGLIEAGDAAATAQNITDSEGLFRAGLVAFLVVFVLDVVIAWALFLYFQPLSRELSRLAAWFRVIHAVLLGAALVFAFAAVELLSGADYLDTFAGDQLSTQAMVMLEAFGYAWLVGLAAFGVHLAVLGYLVLRAGEVSRWLGYLLMLAGAAYFVDTVANTLLSSYEDVEDLFLVIVAIPSVIGELWLGLWLLLRAGSAPSPVVADAT